MATTTPHGGIGEATATPIASTKKQSTTPARSSQSRGEFKAQYLAKLWPKPHDPPSEDGYLIGRAQLAEPSKHPSLPARLSIAGKDPDSELIPYVEYNFYGTVEESSNPKYPPTIKFITFTRAVPHSREGIIRYLRDAPKIGPALAQSLFAKWNQDAIRILREMPEVAAEHIKGLSLDGATEASEWLKDHAAMEDCMVELLELCDKRKFPKTTPRQLIRLYGNKAPEVVRQNPFVLSSRISGIGFKKADALYLDLGHNPAKLSRQARCGLHAIDSDRNGHTWLKIEGVGKEISGNVSGTTANPAKALKLAKRAQRIATHKDDSGQNWIANAGRARIEDRLAKMLVEKEFETASWPKIDGNPAFDSLSPHQREALKHALNGTVGALMGLPGTGKSYTIARIVQSLIAEHGVRSVAVVAPTGKAAVRITQSLAENGVHSIQATTAHRMLGGLPDESGEWHFEYNKSNTLPFRYLIVDESPMVGMPLMHAIFAALEAGCHILFVGDLNQLAPVDWGCPVRDYLTGVGWGASANSSGNGNVPGVGYLTEIQRNAGTIVRACHAIVSGQDIPFDDILNPAADPPANLKHISTAKSHTAVAERINRAVANIAKLGQCDPIWDVQTCIAVNDNSACSRHKLNPALQSILNLAGVGRNGHPFKTGDKAIQLKNEYLTAVDNDTRIGGGGGFGKSSRFSKGSGAKHAAANGEFCKVLEIHPKRTIVEFDYPKRICLVPHAEGTKKIGELDLGYAATVHKMQGSSAHTIIGALDPYPGATGSHGICDRAWLYTLISRGEWLDYLIGPGSCIREMVGKQFIWQRKTFMAERMEWWRGELRKGWVPPGMSDSSTANTVNTPTTPQD